MEFAANDKVDMSKVEFGLRIFEIVDIETDTSEVINVVVVIVAVVAADVGSFSGV